MKGKNYFEKLYGENYKYFLIQYLCGTGKLTNKHQHSSFDVEWELVQHVDGSWKFWITANTFLKTHSNQEYFCLSGQTIDKKYKIKSNSIYIMQMKINSSEPGVHYIAGELKKTIIYNNNPIAKIEGFLSNYNAIDTLPINVSLDEITFELRNVDNYKEIELLYKNKFIKTYSLAKIAFSSTNYKKSLKLLKIIQTMLCLISTNSTFCKKTVFYDDANNISGFELNNYHSYRLNNNYVVDYVWGRKHFLEYFNSTKNFFIKFNNRGFYRIIDYLLKTTAETHIEFMLVGLILSIEYTCKFYFKEILGYDQEEIDKYENIQQKLNHLNSHMKFISSEYLSDHLDELRKDIRNPLFHTGEILAVDYSDLLNVYNKYYDILLRIIFRMIGFMGSYRSAYTNYQYRPV